MDHRRKLYLLLLITLVAALFSCRQEDDQSKSPTPSTVVASEFDRVLAHIDQIEILVSESIPLQVRAKVLGTLPNSCSSIDEILQFWELEAIRFEIITSDRPNPDCIGGSVPFQEFINIDVAGLEAGTYVVDVNGVSSTFTLPELSPGSAAGVISGRIWHDLCANSDSDQNSSQQITPGCIEREDGGVIANGAIDPDEPGIEGLLVSLGEGTCPATGLAVTISDEDGLYLFSGVNAGQYCVSVDAELIQNAAILESGVWSHQSEGIPDNHSITLADGENRSGVNFGWDFAFLPAQAADSLACANGAKFIEDVTVPDNFQVAPGAVFSKTWRIINSGSCSWSPAYSLVHVDGDKLNKEEVIQIPEVVPPGATIDLSVQLAAPLKPGTYRGEWMLRDSYGQLFGFGTRAFKPIWFQIIVSE